ncbi:MAG: type I CRISPR-associated protein Cas7 [Paludibacteraceae bacterium]|nr:type I CRISPR-associated protein Cas7 [Paludibacteraceae bacterium]
MSEFKNRVYGCAVVKAINANYNADFSGQPRTLPNGTVYATDKAFKYTVKNYLKDVYQEEKILGFKRFKQDKEFVPFSLMEAFCNLFPELMEITKKKQKNDDDDAGKDSSESFKLKGSKTKVAKALLSCIDVRTFGFTFAGKSKDKKDNIAISIHGPVQINFGVNLWKEAQKYTDQIMSPFRNPDDKSEDKQASTLGSQSRLDEGHYLHHFSINPQNLCDITSLAGDGCEKLTDDDIEKLKEAMRRGATWYDSASKAGCENEMLVWVLLKEGSKIVLPNFTDLITLKDEKEEGKCVYDFAKLKSVLEKVSNEIDSIDVFYNKQTCKLENLPEKTKENDL